jgi:hypothetical protein
MSEGHLPPECYHDAWKHLNSHSHPGLYIIVHAFEARESHTSPDGSRDVPLTLEVYVSVAGQTEQP